MSDSSSDLDLDKGDKGYKSDKGDKGDKENVIIPEMEDSYKAFIVGDRVRLESYASSMDDVKPLLRGGRTKKFRASFVRSDVRARLAILVHDFTKQLITQVCGGDGDNRAAINDASNLSVCMSAVVNVHDAIITNRDGKSAIPKRTLTGTGDHELIARRRAAEYYEQGVPGASEPLKPPTAEGRVKSPRNKKTSANLVRAANKRLATQKLYLEEKLRRQTEQSGIV